MAEVQELIAPVMSPKLATLGLSTIRKAWIETLTAYLTSNFQEIV
jgi:hypothetical protein